MMQIAFEIRILEAKNELKLKDFVALTRRIAVDEDCVCAKRPRDGRDMLQAWTHRARYGCVFHGNCSGLMTMPRYCAAAALALANAAQAMPHAAVTVPQGSGYCFDAAARRYHVNREVLIAIAWKESHFLPWYRHTNTDGSVDYGLMQINSRNLASLHLDAHSVMKPCTNIMAGAELYSRQVRRFGNTWRAVGSYHSTTPTLRDAYSKDISRRYGWIETLRGWFDRARAAVERLLRPSRAANDRDAASH